VLVAATRQQVLTMQRLILAASEPLLDKQLLVAIAMELNMWLVVVLEAMEALRLWLRWTVVTSGDIRSEVVEEAAHSLVAVAPAATEVMAVWEEPMSHLDKPVLLVLEVVEVVVTRLAPSLEELADLVRWSSIPTILNRSTVYVFVIDKYDSTSMLRYDFMVELELTYQDMR
jgi:hypothetical protein